MATSNDFKEVMARWASGISVITTTRDGEWKGFTANSFASVSIDPLLISMSVAKTLNTLAYIQDSGIFAVNILTQEQQELGMRFAGMIPEYHDNRFAGLDITVSANGSPLLANTLGWMDCKVYRQIDVGASILFLGEVTQAGWSEMGVPLIYYQRQWGRFASE